MEFEPGPTGWEGVTTMSAALTHRDCLKLKCRCRLIRDSRSFDHSSSSSISTSIVVIFIIVDEQCDQIGRFLKFLAAKFLAKEARMIGNFLGYFEKYHLM